MESIMRLQLQKLLDRSKKTNESRNLLAPFSHLKESLLTRSLTEEMRPEYLRQVSLNSTDLNDSVGNDEIDSPMNKKSNNDLEEDEEQSICIFDDLIQDCCDFVENKDISDDQEYYDNKYLNDSSHEYGYANDGSTFSSSQVSSEEFRGSNEESSTRSRRHYLDETKQRHVHEFHQHSQNTYSSYSSNQHMTETKQQCNDSIDYCVLYYYDHCTSNVHRTYHNERNTTTRTNLEFQVRSKDFNFSTFSY